MTDLKAAAEAAKAAHDPDTRAMTMAERIAAQAAFKQAATPDAFLAIYAERDKALTAYRAVKDSLHTMQDRSQSAEQQIDRLEGEKIEQAAEYESVIKGIEAERNAAEASLASYKEEVERLRAFIDAIGKWSDYVDTLTKEPPHAE